MAGSDLPSFHGIIGRSAPMQALFRRIETFAAHDVSVLIHGETGTGKELVAAAVHRLSARSRIPMTIVNCGALRRELLPSELFGHERGAFTGAIARKPGLLAVADGGIVFLDEIGDLPLDAQVMLLRFLQSGEIRPVGSNETRRVNVRLIAATHRDLTAAVRDRAFREDLYSAIEQRHRAHRRALRFRTQSTPQPRRARPDSVGTPEGRPSMARQRAPNEVARKALAGLVRLRMLGRAGLARATRYVSVSLCVMAMSNTAELAAALV